MKFVLNKLPKSEIELKFELPAEEFEKFIEKAIQDLGKDLEIQGFRKGKAPREIIEKNLGREKILNTAAQKAIEENYQKAILEKKIEPVSPPRIEILKLAKGNPFEFKIKTQILSEIELPDYKDIVSKLKKRKVEVTQEEIERLKREKERVEKGRQRTEILEKIAENSKMEIPEILIEEEKKRMLENLKRGVPQVLQTSFEDYLAKLNKTEKEMLDSFTQEARKRIKTSLVLKEIGKREKIEVSPEEIEREIKKISSQEPGIENQLDKNQLREYTKEVLKNEKIFQFLENLIKE
jgi:FKBP-type peptidyl-prolyl cis-trans isomerase (trigger factor)